MRRDDEPEQRDHADRGRDPLPARAISEQAKTSPQLGGGTNV